MTKTELVKVILFLLGAFACAMGMMDYIASTANPWRAAFWIVVFALGFLVFVFFFCRILALLMLRFESKPAGKMSVVHLTRRGKGTSNL
jgi:membrane protein YdbS with pleckstrin-like domain